MARDEFPSSLIKLLRGLMIAFCFTLQFSGAIQVNMSQVGPETRAVGANITVISTIGSGNDGLEIYFKVNDTAGEIKWIATALVEYWSLPRYDKLYDANDAGAYPDIVVSKVTPNGLTRNYMWRIDELTEAYNNLILLTSANTEANTNGSIVLHIASCPSQKTFKTTGQESSYNISSNSPGHFEDTGICHCLESGEELFYKNGSKASGIATCGLDAEWTGCKDVQCWSAPRNISATQFNNTVSAPRPFNCTFTEGFPTATNKIFKLNSVALSKSYVLNSHDHGKNLSCQVVSSFTEKKYLSCESPPETIVVYYSPENSTLSNDSLVIKVNSSTRLNYSVFANPYPNTGGVHIDVYNGTGTASSAGFSPVDNYTNGVHRIFEFTITVSSKQDYGRYEVCSSTENPNGKDCANLSIRNFAAPTTSQPLTTPFSVTTEAKEPNGPGISALLIGVVGAGAILIVLIVVGIFVLYKRRKRESNKDNGKEEKVNELYGSAQYQAPSTGNPESVKQEKPNVLYGSASGGASGDVVEYAMADPDCIRSDGVQYVTSNPDAGNEDTLATDQPCSSNAAIYAQVDKKKGNVNDGYNVEVHDSKPDTAADTYTVIDKSKKRNKDDVPEVYAVVNKPRTKG